MSQKRNNIIFTIDEFEHLLPGTPVAFMDKLEIEDEHISAQIDNVLSVAVIIYLYHFGYQGTVFFTDLKRQGEVGDIY